jgi:transcriptional regulator with XRE-family HTH domain
MGKPSEPDNPEDPAAAGAIQKISYTHAAMIDTIIAHPEWSQNQLAEKFGYSASWVSQIMSSDAFQARLAERSDEIIDPTLRATVKERFEGMVRRSQEILMEKLAKTTEQIPDQLVLRTLEVSARALGYGARDQTIAVQVNMDNHLEDLSTRLVGLLAKKRAEAGPPPLEALTQDIE